MYSKKILVGKHDLHCLSVFLLEMVGMGDDSCFRFPLFFSRPSSVTLKMWIDRRIGGEINTWRKDGRWAADSQQVCSGKLRWQWKITKISIRNTSSKGTFSIAMLKHTRGGMYFLFLGSKILQMMAGHVRCTLAWAPGRLWMVARSCRQSFPKMSNRWKWSNHTVIQCG